MGKNCDNYQTRLDNPKRRGDQTKRGGRLWEGKESQAIPGQSLLVRWPQGGIPRDEHGLRPNHDGEGDRVREGVVSRSGRGISWVPMRRDEPKLSHNPTLNEESCNLPQDFTPGQSSSRTAELQQRVKGRLAVTNESDMSELFLHSDHVGKLEGVELSQLLSLFSHPSDASW